MLSNEDNENELSEVNRYAQVSEERKRKLRAQNQVINYILFLSLMHKINFNSIYI